MFVERQVCKAAEKLLKRFNDQVSVIVYEDDDTKIIKGFAWYGKARDEDKQNEYEINAIYVQPEFTRLGIGEKLVNSVIQKAIEQSCSELIIWVLDGNIKGIKFYDKIGFIEDGERKNIEIWKRDEIRMVKCIK